MKQMSDPTPNPRLMKLSDYLSGGRALDLACGLGGNSLFLAQKNYRVQAMDLSDVAIAFIQDQAEKKGLSLDAQVADLTGLNPFNWQNQSFDIIVMTYYLDRNLFPLIKDILKKDGYLFMETYYQSPSQEGQGVSNQYKLKPKELLNEFGAWKVLFYEENEHEGR